MQRVSSAVRIRTLLRDERGATIVEFAIAAPIICLVLAGGFDISHTLYMRGVVQGIIQKTARDSAIEGNVSTTAQNALDDKVRKQVKAIANNATIEITRRAFRDYNAITANRPEPFTDTNGNGTCNGGEPYTDQNNNAVWDSDSGSSGQGGARDSTLYTVNVSYPRLFPIGGFIPGISNTVTIVGATMVKNQPYGDQVIGTTVRNCA